MKRQKIMIADDSSSIRKYLKELLIYWGYDIEEYENGTAVRDRFSLPRPPELLILDWEMLGLSGIELCRYIKKLDLPYFIYILLLTGRDDKRDIIMGLNSGADEYLTKPFIPEELKARLQAAQRVIQYERELKTREYEVRISCYHALTELAETRDNETGAHLKRLAEISACMASAVGMNPEYQNQIRLFAPMHDIGKVGIPDRILLKPGKLDEQEFNIIKTHTTLGWQILKDKETMKMAAEIALSHHEKWDGSGYPLELSAEAIPLSGRIVAIADVYDALRSKRVYKPAWSHEKATACILESSGSHFQQELVEAFMDNNQSMKEIFDKQVDKEVFCIR